MNAYPLHPVTLAATRAAQAHTTELQARAAASAKLDNRSAKFRTAPAGMQSPAPGINPWLASNWNMTQQSLLLNRDPATAARLRAEAGLDGVIAPTVEDARRAQSSGSFIAKSVAAAVANETAEAPAPASQASPERDSTTASPAALEMTRAALKSIGATVRPSLFVMLAESIDKGARTDASGRVEMFGDDGNVLVDLKGTAAAGRVVGYSPERFLREIWEIEPDAPRPEPEASAKPAPVAEFVPLHVRVQQAVAAGPEAVAALMAEGLPTASPRQA